MSRADTRNLVARIPAIGRILAERDRLRAENAALRQELASAPASRSRRPHLTPEAPTLCEVVNPARYRDPEWLALHQDLERYAVDKHCFQTVTGAQGSPHCGWAIDEERESNGRCGLREKTRTGSADVRMMMSD